MNKKTKYFVNCIIIFLTTQIMFETCWLLQFINQNIIYKLLIAYTVLSILSFCLALKLYRYLSEIYIYNISKYLNLLYVGHRTLSFLYTTMFVIIFVIYNELAWPYLLISLMDLGASGFIISYYIILYNNKIIDLNKFVLLSVLQLIPILNIISYNIIVSRFNKEKLYLYIAFETAMVVLTLYLFWWYCISQVQLNCTSLESRLTKEIDGENHFVKYEYDGLGDILNKTTESNEITTKK